MTVAYSIFATAYAQASNCTDVITVNTTNVLSPQNPPASPPYILNTTAVSDQPGGFSEVDVIANLTSATLSENLRQSTIFCSSTNSYTLSDGYYGAELIDDLTFHLTQQPAVPNAMTTIPFRLLQTTGTYTVNRDIALELRNEDSNANQAFDYVNYAIDTQTPVTNGSISFIGDSATFYFDLYDTIGAYSSSDSIVRIVYQSNTAQFVLDLPPGVTCTSDSGQFPGCDNACNNNGNPCIKVRADPVRGCLINDGTMFNPAFWNDHKATQSSNNCYAYATNTYIPSGGRSAMPQPGTGAGMQPLVRNDPDLTCSGIENRAIADGLRPADCDNQCPSGSRKIALVVAPYQDYHWYRQDSDGTWSHKPGGEVATEIDAAGIIITDPRLANRNYRPYGLADYSQFCTCFCTSPGCNEKIK